MIFSSVQCLVIAILISVTVFIDQPFIVILFTIVVSKGGGQSEVVEHSSSIYRFKLSDTQYVFVQTKSQLIDNTAATHSSAASASDTSPATASSSTHPYIYSVHSIVRYVCSESATLKK